jgi:hypothetical protein
VLRHEERRRSREAQAGQVEASREDGQLPPVGHQDGQVRVDRPYDVQEHQRRRDGGEPAGGQRALAGEQEQQRRLADHRAQRDTEPDLAQRVAEVRGAAAHERLGGVAGQCEHRDERRARPQRGGHEQQVGQGDPGGDSGSGMVALEPPDDLLEDAGGAHAPSFVGEVTTGTVLSLRSLMLRADRCPFG